MSGDLLTVLHLFCDCAACLKSEWVPWKDYPPPTTGVFFGRNVKEATAAARAAGWVFNAEFQAIHEQCKRRNFASPVIRAVRPKRVHRNTQRKFRVGALARKNCGPADG